MLLDNLALFLRIVEKVASQSPGAKTAFWR